ncbi:MAG: PIN domain-containing protein [Actinomycetota bacterium]|nr:PIN domain-containing protein [Actinomycetota bacterium]
MTRAVADTSVFVAQETGRTLGPLPERIGVSVITVAELELGVLRAKTPDVRAKRLGTLSRVRATFPLLPVDPEVASCFARLATSELNANRRLRRHDTWIAATALRHNACVLTQDADFSSFDEITTVFA